MVRIGLPDSEPPRVAAAACLTKIAAICFAIEAIFSTCAQIIERPPGVGTPVHPVCPTLEQVRSSADPWTFDALLYVDEQGLCTGGVGPVPCPTPLEGCAWHVHPGDYPCCTTHMPNTTSFFERWTRLDRPVLLEWFAARRSADPFLAAQFSFGSLGWITMLPAIDALATSLGGQQRSIISAMPTALKTAAILSLVQFTSQLGSAQTAAFISRWPALSARQAQRWDSTNMRQHKHGTGGALAALEISYQMTNSRTLWLYSADRLLLAASLGVYFFCVRTSKPHVPVSRPHATFGLCLAFVCLVGFALDVMRFVSWTIAAYLGFVTLLIDLIMLPIWLVWLGCVLRSVSEQGGAYTTSLEMAEQQQQQQGSGVSAHQAAEKV